MLSPGEKKCQNSQDTFVPSQTLPFSTGKLSFLSVAQTLKTTLFSILLKFKRIGGKAPPIPSYPPFLALLSLLFILHSFALLRVDLMQESMFFFFKKFCSLVDEGNGINYNGMKVLYYSFLFYFAWNTLYGGIESCGLV